MSTEHVNVVRLGRPRVPLIKLSVPQNLGTKSLAELSCVQSVVATCRYKKSEVLLPLSGLHPTPTIARAKGLLRLATTSSY